MIETINLFGNSVSLYFLCWLLGIVVACIIGYLVREDYGFSFAKATIYIMFHWVLGYLFIWMISWLCGGGKTIGFNYVRVVSFAPLYFFLMAKVFRDPFWKVSDFLTPLNAIGFGVSRIGCVFAGCCQGYPSEWGIYSNVAKTVCFPIQIIELVTCMLIGVVLYIMAKRRVQQGKLYVWYMILFGSTRFVFEFFRDNEKLWGNVSELALHALAAFILGVIALIVLRKPRSNEEEAK